jgi:hypothetical protein
MELHRHAWWIRLLLLAMTGSILTTMQPPDLITDVCTYSTLAGVWIGLWPYWKPQREAACSDSASVSPS